MGRSNRAKRDLFGGAYEPDGRCCIRGCGKELWGHEFCRQHYQAWRQNGHPLYMFQRCTARNGGKSSTKEYKTWHGAKMRCTNPNNAQYGNYGGRGISMCERWSSSFDAFLEDMGRAPTRAHSLDRIDVNGNYEPSNCRWATMTEQNRNTRATRLTVEKVARAKRRNLNGDSVADIARDLGVPTITLWQAIRGVSWAEVEPEGNS